MDITWFSVSDTPLDRNGPCGPTFVPLAFSLADEPLVDLIEQAARCHADRIAIDDGERCLTYGQVRDASWRLAHAIDAAVPPDRPVGVYLGNEAAYPIAWLGCLAAGRPAVLLDRDYPQERNCDISADSGLGAILVWEHDIGTCDFAPSIPKIPINSAFEPGMAPPGGPLVRQSPDAVAFSIYTSGSTGRPKGVALSTKATVFRAITLINSVHMHSTDAVLSLVPPCVLGGIQNFLETFLVGATLLKRNLAESGWPSLRGIRPSMLFATPAIIRAMAATEAELGILGGLRCVQPIGDALLRADYRMLRGYLPEECGILIAYGSTEALASLQWFIPPGEPTHDARVATGYLLPGYEIALIDEDGAPCNDGVPGELLVRSRYMALGAWRDGAVHPGPFIRTPESDIPVINTGDIAMRRSDGVFAVLGRKDRQVKVRGQRIELAEIEEHLRHAPGVQSAAVAAQRTEGDAVIHAFVVADSDAPLRWTETLAAYLRVRVPGWMQPQAIHVLSELPLLPGGKVDSVALLASVRSD